MKQILVSKELYRYEIHSLVQAFYPGEEVKVYLEGDEGRRRPEEAAEPYFARVSYFPDRVEITLCREDGSFLEGTWPGKAMDEKCAESKAGLKHLLYALLREREGRDLPWGELIGIRPAKLATAQLDLGKTPEEARSVLMQEHKVSAAKADLAVSVARTEKEILGRLHGTEGYSLYVGIPFCPTTCLYCSFTSYSLAGREALVEQYLTALEKEMEATAPLFEGRPLDTVYVGGGTPTTLSPDQLRRLMEMIYRYFPADCALERTVEAGRPDSITREKLTAMREAGVTRISVNPQTMHQKTLDLIGRRHTVDDVRSAFHLAREEGFTNINMDLILGLPGEGSKEVAETLEEIKLLGPDDLTVHSLALKRGSRMQEWIKQNGYDDIRNTDEMVRIAAEGAAEMGLVPYYLYRQKNISGNFENVGYARPGRYGIYNILIMEEVQSIAALGAGAISKCVTAGGRIERSENCKDLASYLERTDEMCERKRRLFGTV